jgi:hypothetical protein
MEVAASAHVAGTCGLNRQRIEVSEKSTIDDVFCRGLSATRKYRTLRALMQQELASKGFPVSENATVNRAAF